MRGPTLNFRTSPKLSSSGKDYGLLLDDFPGANSAYSFRKLSSAHYGYCLKGEGHLSGVNENVGFIKRNGLFQVDVDHLLNIRYASADHIKLKTWYDQSGGNNDAILTLNSVFLVNNHTPASSGSINVHSTYPMDNEAIAISDVHFPQWTKSKLMMGCQWYNGDGNLNAYKFAAPSTSFSCIIVCCAYDVTGNNNNVIFTDGAGFQRNGIYCQNGNFAFNRSGGVAVVSPGNQNLVSSRMYVSTLKHYSNNTAECAFNMGEWGPITSTGAWLVGSHSNSLLGSYYSTNTTRVQATSLQGQIHELITWPTTNIDMDEVRTRVCRYYGLTNY